MYSRVFACFGALFALATGVVAQQNSTPASILQQALTNLSSSQVGNLTLTGSAESIAGATNDTGTFTANCSTNGASQLSLQLSAGPLTETKQTINGMPTGSWTDSQGQQHAMVYHNLLSPPSWFCPVITLAQITSNTNLNIQYAGQATKNGALADHFIVNSPIPSTNSAAALMVHLSQLDLYLNPNTLLPAVFDFTAHPDSDSSVDIAVEIQFSNYTNVNGTWIPFTVQRYVNSSLALSLQIQSATSASSQQ